MILNDTQIRLLCAGEKPMIEPLDHGEKKPGKISSGLSSFGYDMRLDRVVKVFTNTRCAVIDPKAIDPDCYVDVVGDEILLPPGGFALGVSIEWFNIPNNVMALVVGKSTYARAGLSVNCTPMEAGWSGRLTIELENSAPIPVKIYAGEGIAQAVFFCGDLPERTYLQRSATYQGQTGVTLPRVAGREG